MANSVSVESVQRATRPAGEAVVAEQVTPKAVKTSKPVIADLRSTLDAAGLRTAVAGKTTAALALAAPGQVVTAQRYLTPAQRVRRIESLIRDIEKYESGESAAMDVLFSTPSHERYEVLMRMNDKTVWDPEVVFGLDLGDYKTMTNYLYTNLTGHQLSDFRTWVDSARGGGNRRPGSSNQRPGSSNQRPGSSNQRPGSSNQRPGSSNQRPGSSNQRPGSSGNRRPGS